MLDENPRALGQLPSPTKQQPLQLLSLLPPPPPDCYVDLRGSPAPLPSTPTMPLFPHVLDLLAPLDSSSRALPGTEGLDDFSDGDVLGPELDSLLDSLVSPAVSARSPDSLSHLGPHRVHPHDPQRVEGGPCLRATGGETEALGGDR